MPHKNRGGLSPTISIRVGRTSTAGVRIRGSDLPVHVVTRKAIGERIRAGRGPKRYRKPGSPIGTAGILHPAESGASVVDHCGHEYWPHMHDEAAAVETLRAAEEHREWTEYARRILPGDDQSVTVKVKGDINVTVDQEIGPGFEIIPGDGRMVVVKKGTRVAEPRRIRPPSGQPIPRIKNLGAGGIEAGVRRALRKLGKRRVAHVPQDADGEAVDLSGAEENLSAYLNPTEAPDAPVVMTPDYSRRDVIVRDHSVQNLAKRKDIKYGRRITFCD